MRLIDADRLIESVKIGRDGDDELASIFSTSDIIGRIESQPTVDAVQVVRCKDCVWYEIAERTIDGRPDRRYKPSFCTLWKEYMFETHYCRYGDKEKYDAD